MALQSVWPPMETAVTAWAGQGRHGVSYSGRLAFEMGSKFSERSPKLLAVDICGLTLPLCIPCNWASVLNLLTSFTKSLPNVLGASPDVPILCV